VFKLPSAAADLIVHNGLLAWIQSYAGSMIMEYEVNCMSLGVIRIISRLFKGWSDAETTWHGRSGREVWLQGFVTLVSGLIDRVEGLTGGYGQAVVYEVLKLAGMVQEASPESRFAVRHLEALVDVVEELSDVVDTRKSMGSICSLGVDSNLDLSLLLFDIIIRSPVVVDSRMHGMDKIVLWTIKESYKATRNVDSWLEFTLKCGRGLKEETRDVLMACLRGMMGRVGGCTGYTMMLVWKNMEGVRGSLKRGIEEVDGGDSLPEAKKGVVLGKKQWKVLLRLVEMK
jgi:hypothetical protein